MRFHPLQRSLTRWAVPPAALAAITCFAAGEIDPVASAEGAYLGRLAAAVLLAVAALAPPPAVELGLGAALATAAAWALPAGPGRGSAVLALLAAALVTATARRLRRLSAPAADGARAAPAEHGSPVGANVNVAMAIALCCGWQILLRGELLFAPGHAVRPWVALLALPAAAGLALALLWRRYGMVPALAAAGAAAVLAPGWTVATTLSLVALAAGSSLASSPAAGNAETTGDLGAVFRVAAGQGAWPPRLRMAGGLAAVLLPVAWEPRSGWVAAIAGLALWRPGLAAGLALPLAAVTRFASLPGTLAAHASWREGAHSVAWLVMLVPAALLAARRRPQRNLVVAAALLAFAVPWLPDRSALAAPLALAALALPTAGVAAGLAALWGAAVLGGTALLASYPWLRHDPLGDALGLLGSEAGPRLAVAIGGSALLLGGALSLLPRPRPAAASGARGLAAPWRWIAAPGPEASGAGRFAAWVAGAAVFAALSGPQLARPGVALLGAGDTVLLDHANASWRTEIGPRPLRSVVLESSLVHTAGLASGTPVARVRLLSGGNAGVELLVRAGEDTGEWAALRPDVASTTRLRAARPWLEWVAGDFFGQRYRTRLRLPRASSFARLQIDLAGSLPPDTALALYQVEVEP